MTSPLDRIKAALQPISEYRITMNTTTGLNRDRLDQERLERALLFLAEAMDRSRPWMLPPNVAGEIDDALAKAAEILEGGL